MTTNEEIMEINGITKSILLPSNMNEMLDEARADAEAKLNKLKEWIQGELFDFGLSIVESNRIFDSRQELRLAIADVIDKGKAEARADERTKTFEKCIAEVENLRIVDRLTTHSIEYNEIIDEVKARLEEFQKQEVL
jgi:hypothetical protein